MTLFPGSTVTIDVAVKDGRTGLVYDPAVLTLTVKSPAGAESAYAFGSNAEVVRDAAGRYHADILLGEPGYWHWRWHIDDTYKVAAEGRILVAASNF